MTCIKYGFHFIRHGHFKFQVKIDCFLAQFSQLNINNICFYNRCYQNGGYFLIFYS